jgi:hypothetical protein
MTITLAKGKTQQLEVTSLMADGITSYDVTKGETGTTYSSSNASIATVSEDGLITVLPTASVGGKATITVKHEKISKYIHITVGAAPTEETLQDIRVTPMTITLAKGKTQQLEVTSLMADGITSYDVTKGETGTTYSSSNASIATVNEDGLITVLPTASVGGKATITVKHEKISKYIH